MSRINIEGFNVHFPYQPYVQQVRYMEKVISALEKKQHALLESPTGSGKSLSLLCSTLAWQQKLRSIEVMKWKKLYDEYGKEIVGMSEDELASLIKNMNLSKSDKEKAKEMFAMLEKGWTHKLEKHVTLPVIYYATRTHSQIKQVVKELKKTSYRPEMVVLGSRKQYCIHPDIKKSENQSEDCLKLVEEASCSYYKRIDKLLDSDILKPGGTFEIWDIEDLVKLGIENKACPYYTSQHKLKTANLVFCPYNYLIDPVIRNSVNVVLDNNVVIFDEAHNIEDISREAASLSTNQEELQFCVQDIYRFIQNSINVAEYKPMFHLLKTILDFIENQTLQDLGYETKCKILSKNEMMDLLTLCGITKDGITLFNLNYFNFLKVSNDPIAKKENQIVTSRTIKLIERMYYVFGFLFMNNMQFFNDYHVVLLSQVRRNTGSKRKSLSAWDLQLHFWCMNPRVAFYELKQNCHSIILTSGTLAPLSSFSSELETKFDVSYEGDHVVNLSKQVLVGAASIGPGNVKLRATFKECGSFEFQDSLGEMVLKYSTCVEYGVLCFFPSYSLMNKLISRWKTTDILKKIQEIKDVFIEPRANDKEVSFTTSMKQYYASIKKYEKMANKNKKSTKNGALFFAVCRGKVSEGVDFTDNRARLVIVIGIPFPNIKDVQINLKKKYNDERCRSQGLLNGNVWYSQQAYRAVNQAIGRCIRHKNDFGAIMLVDERYKQPEHIGGLSKWISSQITHFAKFEDSINALNKFFNDLKKNPPGGGGGETRVENNIFDFLRKKSQSNQSSQSSQDCKPTLSIKSIKPKEEKPKEDKLKVENVIDLECQSIPSYYQLECKSCNNKLHSTLEKHKKIIHNLLTKRIIYKKAHLKMIYDQICKSNGQPMRVYRIPNTQCGLFAYSNVVPSIIKDEKPSSVTFNFENFQLQLFNQVVTPGKPFNTGFTEDGVVYELLFCKYCKCTCLGVRIAATNFANQSKIDQLLFFEPCVRRVYLQEELGSSQDCPIDLEDDFHNVFTQKKRFSGFVSASSLLKNKRQKIE